MPSGTSSAFGAAFRDPPRRRGFAVGVGRLLRGRLRFRFGCRFGRLRVRIRSVRLRRLEGLEESRHLPFGIVPPVDGPQPGVVPPEVLQHAGARAVAIPRREGRAEHGTVALDRHQEAIGVGGIADAEVHAIRRAADVRLHGVAALFQRGLHRALEGGLAREGGREHERLPQRRGSLLRVLEERLQVAGAARLRSRQVDLLRPERREDHDLLARAGHGDVQPALPAVPVQRSEVERDPSRTRRGRSRPRGRSRRARRPGRSPGSSRTRAPRARRRSRSRARGARDAPPRAGPPRARPARC